MSVAILPSREDTQAHMVSVVEDLLKRHLALPVGIPLALSLCVLATNLADAFDYCAYVAISSPTKRCGKTTLAQLLSWLCHRAMFTVGISAAALFRLIERYHPTIILDEAELLLGDRSMHPFLNAGFRKGAVVPRVIGKDIVQFAVYGPKVFCLIGEVPDTIRDRSILIEMRRAKPGDVIAELRERMVQPAATELASRIADWAASKRNDVIEAYCRCTLNFLSDREANLWAPLFAIASVAVPERLDELTAIAMRLVAEKAKHDAEMSPAIQLLSDLQAVFAAVKPATRVPTGRLLCDLRNLPDSAWGRLSGSELACKLRLFGIRPQQLWVDGKNIRGYLLKDFIDAFERYLPAEVEGEIEAARAS